MHNPDSVAAQRHNHIIHNFRQTPFVEQAHAAGLFESEKEAESALCGLLQWLALPSYCAADGFPPVMMSGPVAKMYGCLAADPAFYETFCRRYMGETLHPIPVMKGFQHDYVTKRRWTESTWMSLSAIFGTELAPVLRDWSTMKRDSDIVFVGMFPDQLHRHHQLVPWEMMDKIRLSRTKRQVEDSSLTMT